MRNWEHTVLVWKDSFHTQLDEFILRDYNEWVPTKLSVKGQISILFTTDRNCVPGTLFTR